MERQGAYRAIYVAARHRCARHTPSARVVFGAARRIELCKHQVWISAVGWTLRSAASWRKGWSQDDASSKAHTLSITNRQNPSSCRRITTTATPLRVKGLPSGSLPSTWYSWTLSAMSPT
jgi:hypothetical protein